MSGHEVHRRCRYARRDENVEIAYRLAASAKASRDFGLVNLGQFLQRGENRLGGRLSLGEIDAGAGLLDMFEAFENALGRLFAKALELGPRPRFDGGFQHLET